MVGPDWAGGGRQERGHLPHGGVGGLRWPRGANSEREGWGWSRDKASPLTPHTPECVWGGRSR